MNINGIWKNLRSDGTLCTDMLLQYLQTQTNGVILLDGPGGCGKTSCLRELKNASDRQVFLFSYRDITDEIIRTKCNCQRYLRDLSEDNSIVCIEDVDYLSGREATQTLLSQMVQTAAERHLVILTGSNVQMKTPIIFNTCGLDVFGNLKG